ncbi:MAG: flavin reductase family protein [Chloroflexi bacterium]|nr:flavin reductase family protein [Chloroflexota bacterium]
MDAETKRTVLRMFTYGLYALTIADGDKGHGATVNWVSQVSFDPALLAVSVEKNSRSIELLRQEKAFAINVYRADQRDLAGQLGRRFANRPDKFQGVRCNTGVTGAPLLADSLAYVECRVVREADAGDSVLILADIVEVGVSGEGKPLTMEAAGFRHAG